MFWTLNIHNTYSVLFSPNRIHTTCLWKWIRWMEKWTWRLRKRKWRKRRSWRVWRKKWILYVEQSSSLFFGFMKFCMDVSLFICSSMQDDHEITIDELELKYTTSVSKVTYKKNHCLISQIFLLNHSNNLKIHITEHHYVSWTMKE